MNRSGFPIPFQINRIIEGLGISENTVAAWVWSLLSTSLISDVLTRSVGVAKNTPGTFFLNRWERLKDQQKVMSYTQLPPEIAANSVTQPLGAKRRGNQK